MRSLHDLIEEYSGVPLEQEDLAWLHSLMSDWQVLADLSSSDFVLWLRTQEGAFVAASICRSATSTTVHVEDVVGLRASRDRLASLDEAYRTGKIVRSGDLSWSGTYSMSMTSIPVVRAGRVVAALSMEANFSVPPSGVGVQAWTAEAAQVLCHMIAAGEYPYDSTPHVTTRGVPRVNDGAILLDEDGIVLEATPNANSCLRRLGLRRSQVGQSLIQKLTQVVSETNSVDETLAVVAMGRASWQTEISVHASTVMLRALPLTLEGRRVGAVLLTRDISEIVSREQELMTKDATIREIHHRVKNNLQTVSALLRMQSRRSCSDEVKQALHEAGRRVEAIATVHESLSHNVDEIVDFDQVAASILRMAATVATTSHQVQVRLDGQFGTVPADAAAALATVLTELVTNSVEHGLSDKDGSIWVRAQREGCNLVVEVEDDGEGFSEGTELSGLGTQIVRMMVRGELDGTIKWSATATGGCLVRLGLTL